VNDTATLAPPWRANAACRGLDPSIFYPLTDEEALQAKSVCESCPVQASCLEHALGIREKEGVWGGRTERERRRIIRQRRRSA
jgi:WhiB family redox-sensing transcriptional regulator